MNCCTECFNDEVLRKMIHEATQVGQCGYCSAEGVNVFEASELSDTFEVLLGLYEQMETGQNTLPGDEDGEPLAELIQEDWDTFSDRMTHRQRSALLGEIFNGQLSYRDVARGANPIEVSDMWVRQERNFAYRGDADIWGRFKSHIKTERRYVFNEHPRTEVIDPEKWLPDHLNSAATNLQPCLTVYRARIGAIRDIFDNQPYGESDLGPPPPEFASAGRGNPRGIPVMYLALDEATAVAEVRPWKGANVSVGDFTVTRELRLVDLSVFPYLRESPFVYGESSELIAAIESNQMLRALAYDLSEPITPNESDIEYVPTQYLSELAQSLGFDGVLYPSAMGSGKNLILYDSKTVRFVTSRLMQIDEVQYTYSESLAHSGIF